MINPLEEEPISLRDATKLLPGRRQSKRPTVSCLYRWTTDGCRGVILESVQVGATRCTTKEAIARFIHELSKPAARPKVPPPQHRLSSAVERKLRQFGMD